MNKILLFNELNDKQGTLLNILPLTGEYFKNRCDPSTSNCIPCPNRLPSCKGLPNGRQTITNLYDGLQYLADCSLNRTMSYKLCTPGSIECAAATTPTVTTQAPVTRPAMITFFPPIQTQATTVQPSNQFYLVRQFRLNSWVVQLESLNHAINDTS